ncbi:hypothetical protein [Falsihalocynthiibacter arcticus]|uniref:Uncharacterized protein n=1 Tax=Falsihalocynthiibacter arcticus TaxID=1579316 RepID=A0A126V2J1_9RHOB|nr:hypothetical protein [Falsihalocynthiibacter arcticus]AML52165.1 hypothetical protein RC74_13580 [Falsihalocynthiibacter arcticus]
MKFAAFEFAGQRGLAIEVEGAFRGLMAQDEGFSGDLLTLIRAGAPARKAAAKALGNGPVIDMAAVAYLPLWQNSRRLCVLG